MNCREFFVGKEEKLDDLTSVYKREVIQEYVEYLVKNNVPFNLCFIDVDNFKHVNDNYGHLVGDKVLVNVADRILSIVDDDGVVGRYGGDEFIVIYENVTEYDDVWKLQHELLSVATNFGDKVLDSLQMTVTIGSSRFPKDANNGDTLFELADKALYRGKMKGRNCFIIYLAEKHAGINLKTERDKVVSSMYIHAKIHSLLTRDSNIKDNIQECINYIGGYFMIDHLSIETDKNLYFNYYHPICKTREFVPVGTKNLSTVINPTTGFFFKNEFSDEFNAKVENAFLKQNVYSVCLCDINAFGTHFGYLRADICENPRGRVWQNLDMDLLLKAANTIALILYFNKLTIEEL